MKTIYTHTRWAMFSHLLADQVIDISDMPQSTGSNKHIWRISRLIYPKSLLASCILLSWLKIYLIDISLSISDEYHYFSHCSNKRLEKLRENFLNELVDFNCKFSSLGTNNILLYCVSMNDKNIINSTAKYIYEIMNNFWDLACI